MLEQLQILLDAARMRAKDAANDEEGWRIEEAYANLERSLFNAVEHAKDIKRAYEERNNGR